MPLLPAATKLGGPATDRGAALSLLHAPATLPSLVSAARGGAWLAAVQRMLLSSNSGPNSDEELGPDTRKVCLDYGPGLWVEQNSGRGGGPSSRTAELTYENPSGVKVG